MNGDEVRNIGLTRLLGGGYDASEVNNLLLRVAAELDAERPIWPLIAKATFQTRSLRGSYQPGPIDWFLDQLRWEDLSEMARVNADPWRDLAAEPYYIRREPGDVAGRIDAPSRREYQDAWDDFGQQSGTYLRWETIRSSRQLRGHEFELRTANQQAIAFLHGSPIARTGGWITSTSWTVSAAGRSFTVRRPKIPARSKPDCWPPGIAEVVARIRPHFTGHYSAGTTRTWAQRREARRVGMLVNETGTPVMYLSGHNSDHRANARVTFPDQRWLRFPVRGTHPTNAIMTAVDQAGSKVARYRDTSRRQLQPPIGTKVWADTVEIAVHPDQELTLELILAIAISAPLVTQYFHRSGGGGGG